MNLSEPNRIEPFDLMNRIGCEPIRTEPLEPLCEPNCPNQTDVRTKLREPNRNRLK